jgi:two-component system sensor histidine kinase QseC
MKSVWSSLRHRLVISIGVAMLAVMGAVSVAVYWAISHESDEIFKARLATSAKVLEGLISQKLNELPIDKNGYIEISDPVVSSEADPSHHPYEQKVAFQVWNQMGVLLAKSASAPVAPLGGLTEGVHKTTIGAEEWQVFALKSGDIWVMAAEHNDVLEESTVKLVYAIFTPFAVGGLALVLLVNFLLIRGLSPIKDIADQISQRDGVSEAPILGSWPTELRMIVDAFNNMLSKVTSTIKREKLFLDSAAHEIRTPLAAIRLHLQNALNSRDKDSQFHSVQLAHQGVLRASRLVSQMMELSRIDAHQSSSESSVYIALEEIVQRMADDMKATCDLKRQTIVVEADPDVVVNAPLTAVESVVSNLLDNACKYGLPDSCIRVCVRNKDKLSILSLQNAGPVIPEQEKENIFLPYYRNAAGSQDAVLGSGLGLAIVKRIADKLEARIDVEDVVDPIGTRIKVKFLQPG